ncbi:MAG: helix-turn-helix domain-containing protein [Erysipelotrichaceae bacterium]|nr:helix-turn-helix domain-containing protein [Erysipelotrichaceae bacterium]
MLESSRNYVAIPPGMTIKELLQDRGISQKEFAVRIGASEKHVSKLINGEVHLTMDMARKLETVLGPSTQFWCNLESLYRENLALASEENALDADKNILNMFSYNEIANLGWVEKTNNKTQRIYNLRKFFEVAQLSFLNEQLIPNVIYRKLSLTNSSDYKLLAWCQKAKLDARNIYTNKINISLLKRKLPDIRYLCNLTPSEFCDTLVSILAECGIALVFLPHLKGSFLHGATFYDNHKIVVGLTVRGKDADRFWFSLFHELGHIINEDYLHDEYYEDIERNADTFARNLLINETDYQNFILKNAITEKSIIDFANSQSIDQGIVVGRLQADEIIPYSSYNYLKTKYEINE